MSSFFFIFSEIKRFKNHASEIFQRLEKVKIFSTFLHFFTIWKTLLQNVSCEFYRVGIHFFINHLSNCLSYNSTWIDNFRVLSRFSGLCIRELNLEPTNEILCLYVSSTICVYNMWESLDFALRSVKVFRALVTRCLYNKSVLWAFFTRKAFVFFYSKHKTWLTRAYGCVMSVQGINKNPTFLMLYNFDSWNIIELRVSIQTFSQNGCTYTRNGGDCRRKAINAQCNAARNIRVSKLA